MEQTKRVLDRSTLPCRRFREWYENQAPLGSGRYWPEHFTDCARGEDCTEEEAASMDAYGKCDNGCPCFEPAEIAICPKHGEYVAMEGCDLCEAEAFNFGDEEMFQPS